MLYGDQGIDAERAAARRRASVLVPIVARAGELTMLFTRRTAHLRNHSGQIAFPGGGAEPGDASAEATALREAHEEIGLEPARVEVLGRLSDYHTRTDYRVTPVVGLVAPPVELRLDAHEVEEAFEVPLAFLLDPANHLRHQREFQGRTVPFYAIPYRDYYIWGATAGMLINLYRFLAGEGE
jgi:8-oxo-dGTP pyrophosphatase MutT (NUDIX family)